MTETELVEFITKCYKEILKREPDQQGLSHFLKEIQEERISKDKLTKILESSKEYYDLISHISKFKKTDLVDVTTINELILNSKENLLNFSKLRDFLETCQIVPGPKDELKAYVDDAFYRFVKTLQLIPNEDTGKLLEIGSNPYFMTILLKKFRKFDYQGSNFFSTQNDTITQTVVNEKYGEKYVFTSTLFNIENKFPYDDESFDYVLFCEVIEHLIKDPIQVIQQIHRILKPNGTLILTTPNVARASNIEKLQRGENIYDPYSRYGVYGRHNREYTVNELSEILSNSGFKIIKKFTKFVHIDFPDKNWWKLEEYDNYKGDYIFILARKHKPFKEFKPNWLFR